MHFTQSTIESITIPKEFTVIEKFAFLGCQQLHHVEFSKDSKLQTIEEYAFARSTIESITTPKEVTMIGKGAFFECIQLQLVDFSKDSKLETIEEDAFSHTIIKSITIPKEVTVIGKGAFYESKQLHHIEFSKDSKIQTIDDLVFYKSNIESITIPSSVTDLKEYWCYDASKLKRVEISPSNERYHHYNEGIIIGKSSNETNDYDRLVFCNRDIKTITIPNFIKYISSSSFARSSLEILIIPSEVTYIGKNAFYECKQLRCVEFSKDLKLQRIEESAFYCIPIEKITIPSEVIFIGQNAFCDCVQLRCVEFSKDSKLQTIEESAFHYTPIEKITIPSEVIFIGKNAFCSCSYLHHVEFSKDSKLQIIGDYAFGGLSIESITIPKEVTVIGVAAFGECHELKHFEYILRKFKQLELKTENKKLKEKDKKQSDTIKTLEEDNRQLKSENKKLKEKDKKQSDTIKTLEEDSRQPKNEIKKLKTRNKKMSDTIKDIKEKGQEKSKIEQKREKNGKRESEAKSKKTKTKEKQHETSTIIVSGYDEFNLLGEKPNNKGEYGTPVIFPPLKISLDSSSLLSYTVYIFHSVLVTRGGSLLGIGYNTDGRISSSLTETEISQFTEFSIKDDRGRQLTPISAVCSDSGTLYMFSKISGDGRQLVYCDQYINDGYPVFLDIGDEEPVALFGSYYHAAAISDKGEVIFINRFAVQNSPNSRIAAVSLPDGEKTSSIACLRGSVFVLSSKGRVFCSSIEPESNVLRFSLVSELSGYKIVWVSGTRQHCLAVSKEGHVFGLGSNECGQLGLGKKTESVSYFTEISSLLGYKIRAAYAGSCHSLFETREGKILSCGSNQYGQLLLSSGLSKENVYSPRETMFTGGATFCIAGAGLSSVFVGGYPPRNTPNMGIKHHQ